MKIDQVYKQRFADVELRKELWETLVVDFFQNYVSKGDVVLDLPCGYAEFINTIKCKKKYAIDINPDSKKHVAKDVIFYRANSMKTPLKDRTIDKVFISNFFEHLTHDQIVATIEELHRVLKKGGRVMVLQPNIRFAFHNYWMFFDHVTAIDDRALEEVFGLHGFTLEERILKFLPFTANSRLPAKKIFVKAYLRCRPLWRVMGRQSFLVFEKR
jgi:SAM-dependent methyltransferase